MTMRRSLAAMVVALLFGACSSRHLVITPDPSASAIGLGLTATFKAYVADCGGVGDCRHETQEIAVTMPDGSTTGSLFSLTPVSLDPLTVRVNAPDLSQTFTINVASISKSQITIDSTFADQGTRLRAFVGSSLRFSQGYFAVGGKRLYGSMDWIGGATCGQNCQKIALASVPIEFGTEQQTVRIEPVDQSAIASLQLISALDRQQQLADNAQLVLAPDHHGNAVYILPRDANNQLICGTGEFPKISSDAFRVSPIGSCGVALFAARKPTAPSRVEITWGSTRVALTIQ
jgi:hypothetical protein